MRTMKSIYPVYLKVGLLLAVFILIIAQCKAQDCAKLVIQKTDRVTGNQSRAMSEPILVSKDDSKGIILNIYESKQGQITFYIKPVGASNCIEEGQKVNILFRDGTRTELLNASSFNCDGDIFIFMGGAYFGTKKWKELAAKEIEVMRVWTKDGYVEEEFTEENSRNLKQAFNCFL
jgi:hypothetical protein